MKGRDCPSKLRGKRSCYPLVLDAVSCQETQRRKLAIETTSFCRSHRDRSGVRRAGGAAAFLPGELGANLLSELQSFLVRLSGEDVLLFQLSLRGPVAEFDG